MTTPKFQVGEKVKVRSSIYSKIKPGEFCTIVEAIYAVKNYSQLDRRTLQPTQTHCYELVKNNEEKGLVFDECQLEAAHN